MELREEGVRRHTLVWTKQWSSGKGPRRSTIASGLIIRHNSSYHVPRGSADHYAFGQEPHVQPTKPRTWLLESIWSHLLVLMRCFLSLLGIIGIIYAAQVESFYNRVTTRHRRNHPVRPEGGPVLPMDYCW